MTLIKFVLILAGAYAIIVALMFAAQTWLLFPTWLVGSGGLPLPADAERLGLTTPDGVHLSGVRIGPRGPGDREPLRLIAFGGNAWPGDDLAAFMHQVVPDAEVIAFSYRGYAPSGGSPSASALMADGLVVFDHVLARFGPRRTVAVGLSIGAGVAVRLARHRPLSGLLLITPFDSLTALARSHYPWLPVGLLLRHRMAVANELAGLDQPVAVIAAAEDAIVPPPRTAALRRAARNLVFDRTMEGVGHNDLYAHPAFGGAVREALHRIVGNRVQ